jgi:hypothetical protein
MTNPIRPTYIIQAAALNEVGSGPQIVRYEKLCGMKALQYRIDNKVGRPHICCGRGEAD